ncbi:siderophore peptide synthetase involved in ferrichromea biosynthesis [Moesziomyces aphidis]|uniref:Siderophore peptide synthetase involved in ferrichromea biosynthesis n=1 Tax=Moesziomyces aphidis TaxID=84754 RepID=W3VDU8_MOEAP|nr:siderophore peptide synthetase involved in ferrichromea biosynthesis [Moesziomyces aphidis]
MVRRTLSRLPALHPYSTGAATGAPDGDRTFKFTLRASQDSVERLAHPDAEHELISLLATFVAQLVGCNADEVLFKLNVDARQSCLASADGVEEQVVYGGEMPPPGIAISFTTAFGRASSPTSSVNDDVTIAVECIQGDGKGTVEVNIRFAQAVPAEAARGICAHFCRQVLNSAMPESEIPLSVLNSVAITNVTRDTRLHQSFLEQARRFPERIAVQFLENLDQDGSANFKTLTYAELRDAAFVLANKLRKAQAKSKKQGSMQIVVPMIMSASLELYVSYIAILVAGFAFCPLPADAPHVRLALLLEQLDTAVLLGDKDSDPPQWMSPSVEWINVTDTLAEVEHGDKVPTSQDIGLDKHEQECAYVLFTSGTTGTPKGVQISHYSASVSIAAHADHLHPTLLQRGSATSSSTFKWFQFASTVFDPSVMEIFVTLSVGGTLCSAPRALTLSDLETVVRISGADIMMATPSVATLLRPHQVPNLRFLWTMGESLNATVIRNFAADDARTCLANAYGPTEASVNCTLLQPFPADYRGSIIGMPMSSCSLAIVHDYRNPGSAATQLETVPQGVTGELVIGGPHVGMGYLNMPAATEDAFTTLPPLGRVYRTQDRARLVWDLDGRPLIEILGRMNAEQVKLSGRRVELGEVDSVLQSSELIRNAANVVWRPPTSHGQISGSERLVCCIVLAGASISGKDAEADCRAVAEAQLPPHMRPWKYIVQSNLPVTISGKSDRKRLAQLVSELLSSSTGNDGGIISPQHQEASLTDDLTSQAVVQAIKTVCQLEASSISMSADLFELGMDSLAAMRLLQLLRRDETTACAAGGLDVAQVLRARSCADLARLISGATNPNDADDHGKYKSSMAQREQDWSKALECFRDRCHGAVLSALSSEDTRLRVQSTLPTTATQSGMLTSFLTRAESSDLKRPYINHTVYHMASSLDARRLYDALRQALQRHDIYRTVFVPIDDQLSPFAQCILSPGPDYGNVSTCSSATTLTACLEEHLTRVEGSISLDQPPWHLGLLLPARDTDDGECLVVLSMMHAIFDGGSLDLLQQEATDMLHEDSCSSSTTSCRTQLENAVKHHYTSDLEGSRRFWKEKLDGVGRTRFPCVNGHKSAIQAGLSKSSDVIEMLSRSSMDAVSRQARCQRTTVLALLQTAWNLLLAAYAEDEDIEYLVSGSVQSGRLDEETRFCMAPTFNVIPFITELGNKQGGCKDKRVAQLLAEATEASTAALDHLEIPLGALATSGFMPFDTLFAVQRFDGSESCDQRQQAPVASPWNSISYPVMANDFAVMVEIWPASPAEGELRLRLTYSQSVLDGPSAQLLLHQYDDILHRLMQDPDSTSVEQVINGEGLRRSAISSSCGTESTKYGAEMTLLHSQFEGKAFTNPSAIALEFFSSLDASDADSATLQRWTYGELNARANRLARLLLSITGKQTLRDQPIPICMERCAELYVAVLAILKAGGAWCPIDVQSPRARQLELIARTRSSIILITPATSARLGVIQAERQAELVHVDVCDPCRSSHLSSDNLHPTATPDSLAYLIWTSGTTGAPKGVMIEHCAVVTSMRALQYHVRPPHQDKPPRCLQVSAYTFDVFVQDLFWTWGLGGTVVTSTRELMLGSTAELVMASQANHAHLTPAFAAGLPRASCPSLTSVTFIGEKLTESVAADWAGCHEHDGRQLAPPEVYNTYGPAEVTVVAALRRLDAHDKLQSANVGAPMQSVSVFVCRNRDQPLRPCGKGTVGELVLAGPQVGRGYLDDQQKTEAAFKFCPELQQRLYYTGDYVRMLHDGSIEFIGRRDDLVKLGGIRVELSEISAALISVQEGRAGGVAERAETMMLSRPDRPSKQVISFLACPDLAAAVESRKGEGDAKSLLLTSTAALELAQSTLQHVGDVLPPYMVPSMVLVLSRIPQTASAKIDRAQLQAAYASADLSSRALSFSSLVSPPTSTEEQDEAFVSLERRIITSISEVTGTATPDISKASSLASIGLDSIRVIRLAAKLKQGGIPVQISTLLACSMVHTLVKEVRRSSTRKGAQMREDTRSQLLSAEMSEFDISVRKVLPSRLQDGLEIILPCSGLQEGMLTETLSDPLAYWSDHLVRLDAKVDLGRFAHAWERTVNSIDMLRTVFAIVSQTDDLEEPVRFDGEIDVFALQLLYRHADTSCFDFDPSDALSSEEEIHWAVSEWRRSVAMDRVGVSLAKRPLWAVKTFTIDKIAYSALCIHHALYDGSSIKAIWDRVHAEYDALGSGQRDALPPLTSLPAQCKYAFACTAEERSGSLHHWETQLGARGPATLLPDLTSVKVSSDEKVAAQFVAARRSFRYKTSRPLAVGVSTLIKTALAMVLGQYAETEDSCHIVLGEVLSLRHLHTSLSTERGAVGPLLTTLPFSLLLTAASKHESIVSICERGAIVHPSIKHRFAPLGALARIMGTRQDQEMFTAMYVYHQFRHPDGSVQKGSPQEEQRWALLEERESDIRVEHSTVLNVHEQGETDDDGLLLELSMKEDRVSNEMLGVLLEQVVSLLDLMISNPEETAHSLLVKVGESSGRLSAVHSVSRGTYSGGNEGTVYRGYDPLHWLAHHSKHHPTWPAVIIATGKSETGSINEATLSAYTYAELNAKSDQVSVLIRSLDLPAKGPIALCMRRSLISFAVTVAIFKCGRTYLPIDDQLPAERKRLLITDSSCALVVTEGHCLGDAQDDCKCLVLNTSDEDFEQRLAVAQEKGTTTKDTSAGDAAYLLYTSGSTGKPKGVLVGRANLCSFVEAYAEVVCAECPSSLRLGGTGRYLGLAGRAFDVHLSQMFMSWRFGMALATGERSLLLGDLKATIQRLSITHMSCVPSLLDHCDLVAEEVPSLVFLGVGGERLTDRVRDTLASKLTVLNAYGPTETTIMCTVNRVHADSHVRDIGHILPGNTALVLDFDDRDQPSPILRGRAGELCIRGDLVALGYHALAPSQRASSGFVTLPDGTRMYRTGDSVRMMADGRLHYLGRRDEQEKIRGQRLELGEVSQCVIAGADEEVHATTLILQHQRLAKPLLITLIAPKSTSSATRRRDSLPCFLDAASEMVRVAQRAHLYCKQHLPSYMVPDLVVAVSHLTQLAASGKTDTRGLKAWLASTDPAQLFQLQEKANTNASFNEGLQVDAERELTVLEAKVARAVGQILPRCPIKLRPATSIFDLGIDSISVIRLASQLRKCGLIVPIAQLRMRPRIHQIASMASAFPKGNGETSDLDIDLSVGSDALEAFGARHRERLQATRADMLEDVLPCLPSQEGMIALSLSASSTKTVYVARMRISLDIGRLPQERCPSEETLRRAWLRLAQRHSILRTCFDHVDDGTIAQVVLQHVDIERHLVHPSPGEREPATPLAILRDISAVPPWRIEFEKDSSAGAAFVLFMHHALYDGHSLALLLGDLTTLLQEEDDQCLKSEGPRMQNLIESILAVPAQQAQIFWCSAFVDYPVNEPSVWDRFDRVSAPTSGSSSVRCKASLQLKPLEAAAQKLQVTLSSLLAAALGIALSRSLGTPAFTLGHVLWGRSLDLASAEQIVAPCLTTVPMPFSLCAARGAEDLADIVRACYEWNSSCLAFQHTSMRQIRKWIGSERQGSIVDLLFSFIQSDTDSKARRWHLDQIDADTDAPAAVEVTVDAAIDELRISAMVKHVLPQGGLEAMVETLCLLLNKIASGAGARMSLEAAGVPKLSSASIGMPYRNGASKLAMRPMTEVEEKIRNLAVDMCGAPSADLLQLDTPFLRIGLDSIVALRFSARLRSECKLQLSAHDVLTSGSVAGLSQLLDQRRSRTNASDTALPSPTDATSRYEATPLQAGMLNGTIASPNHDLYVHHHAVLLNEAMDYDRLQRALQRLVAAHDILRTAFHLEELAAGQKLAEPGLLSWIAEVTPFDKLSPRPQLSHRHSNNAPSKVLREYGADFRFDRAERFNVSPWQAAVLHCASQEDVLVISMHHSLYDGVSLPSLFADMKKVYRDETAELMVRQPFSLAADLIRSTAQESKQYWQQTLTSFDRPSLLVQGSAQVEALATAPYRLDEVRLPITATELKQRSAELGTAPQAVALLGWAKVLAVCSGQRDVCFGQVVSGRYLTLPGIEDISGPLINTVPIRVRLEDDLSSNAAAARDLHKRVLAAQPFQHASLGSIQNAWKREHAAYRTLFDSLFVFHNVSGKSQAALDGTAELWTGIQASEGSPAMTEGEVKTASTSTSEYPVNISVIQDDRGIVIKAGASDAVGGAGWLATTLQMFAEVLSDLLHRPHRPVGAFPEALAALPLATPADGRAQEADNRMEVGDGRRRLTSEEQKIVLRHFARRLNAEEGAIVACPNLFLLGIDSLLAICISADARSEGVSLTPYEVLSAGTFARLTVLSNTAEESSASESTRPAKQESVELVSSEVKQEAAVLLNVAASEIEAVLPVLTGQKQHINLWLQRGRRFLEPTFVYATEHKLDAPRLASAWRELCRRNAALRTAFVRSKANRTVVQVVFKEACTVLRHHERSKLALVDGGDDVDSAAFEAVKRLNASPSDLSRPSVRLTLVQGKQKDLVLLTVHHTSYDAWSIRLMAYELTQLYRNIEKDGMRFIPDPVSWIRFVEQASGDALRSQVANKALWDRILCGASPTLVCRGVQQSIEQTMHVRKAALKEADVLDARCRTQGVGLQEVVILAYARLLSSLAGNRPLDSPTFGFYTAGRSSAFDGLGALVGPTTAMQPMTVAVGAQGSGDLLGQLRRIQRQLVQRSNHQQDDVVCPVAFDAHLNLLWHKPNIGTKDDGEVGEKKALLKPHRLPHDSGYFTRHPLMHGKTSVDYDPSDAAVPSEGTAQLYMDVGLDAKTGALSLGARCDRSAMETQRLEEICDAFVVELEQLCASF